VQNSLCITSCVLLYWQCYYTTLEQWASAKLCGMAQEMELRNFSSSLLPHHMAVWLGYIVSVCLFVCMVTDFSAAEEDSGVKLCKLVQLLSEMSFSDFGEVWPRGG